MSGKTQDDVFEAGEGDRWFERNRDALGHDDCPLRLIDRNALRPESVLEIGCANGWRLAAIGAGAGAGDGDGDGDGDGASRLVGVDVSSAAIAAGMSSYPALDLRVGRADRLPIEDEVFDLVIVNYVFHWIDRATIFAAISETDRCVAPDGYLLVGDFLPDRPTKVPYHHLPDDDVFTFKADYASAFTVLSTYEVVDCEIYNHDDPSAEPTSQDRGACTLLRKSLSGLYA